ncbi:MAG: hypothetical protein ACXVLQ_02775, partial [Bacteriovorax sp.]
MLLKMVASAGILFTLSFQTVSCAAEATIKALSERPRLSPLPEKQLEKEAVERKSRVIEFRKIEEFAKKNGVSVSLRDESALDWLQYVHSDLEREGGNKAILPELFDYDLDRIFLPEEPVKLSLQSNDKVTKKALLEFLKKEFPGTLWEITEASQSEDLAAQARAISGRKIPLDPQILSSGTEIDQIENLTRYLTRAFRYDLDVPEKELKSAIKKIKFNGLTKESVPAERYNELKEAMKELVYSSSNIERAYDVLNRIGFSKGIHDLSYQYEGQGHGSSSTRLDSVFEKQPLPWSWTPETASKSKNGTKLERLVHNTKPNFYHSMMRNPFGALNAFESLPSDGYGHAESGEGFYTFSKSPEYAAYGPYRMYFSVNRPFVEGSLRTGGALSDEVVLNSANGVRIIPEVFPSNPMEMAANYVDPTGFAEQGNPGKLSDLARRIDRNWSPELRDSLDKEIRG